MIPAGWIPPEFREFVYGPLGEDELQSIQATCGYFDAHGNMQRYTLAELRGKHQKIIGVKDTRTGEFHPQVSGVKFMEARV